MAKPKNGRDLICNNLTNKMTVNHFKLRFINFKKLKFYLLITAIFLVASCKNAHGLFKENKDGWFATGDANWIFYKHELIGKVKNGTGFVVTNKRYKDFVITMEFKPDSTINSGVFIRCEKEPPSAAACYEINIWDLNPNPDYRTGSIVKVFVPLAKVETIYKWNTYEIKNEKNHLQVWVNDILTVNTTDKSHREGFVGLQAQGIGEIKFRNIKIKDLN